MATTGENPFKLQAITPKHEQVASLLAQGLGPSDISALVDFTPQYITMLTRDPLFKEVLRNMSAVVDARIEALYGKVGDVIADGMMNGSVEERIKAARLQLEVTRRIGSRVETTSVSTETSLERLAVLAERLLALQPGHHQGDVIDVEAIPLQDQQSGGQDPQSEERRQWELQGQEPDGSQSTVPTVRTNGCKSDQAT